MHNSTNKLSGRWSTLLKRHSNAPTAAIALCFSTGIAFSLICHEYLFSCFAVAGIALIFASATVLHKGRLGLSLVLGLAAILLSGLLMATFAIGLRKILDVGTAPHIGTLSLLLSGCALAGLAFTTDPTLRSTPATWHGRLHDLSFVLLGLFMLVSMLGLGRAFQNDSRWRGFGLYTFITASCAIPSFAIKGLAFYLFLSAILTWSILIALKLLRFLDQNYA